MLAFDLSYLFEEKALLTQTMTHLLGCLTDGKLRAPTVTTYPMSRVADAHRDLESAQTIGKLVLDMCQEQLSS